MLNFNNFLVHNFNLLKYDIVINVYLNVLFRPFLVYIIKINIRV